MFSFHSIKTKYVKNEKFSFQNNHFSFKFPFDICESNGSVFVTDNEKHCVFNLDVDAGSMAPVISVYDDAGE